MNAAVSKRKRRNKKTITTKEGLIIKRTRRAGKAVRAKITKAKERESNVNLAAQLGTIRCPPDRSFDNEPPSIGNFIPPNYATSVPIEEVYQGTNPNTFLPEYITIQKAIVEEGDVCTIDTIETRFTRVQFYKEPSAPEDIRPSSPRFIEIIDLD